MLYAIAAVAALVSYLVGSINPSIILSRSIYGKDIREFGSGNAGTTNMLRTHGKGMALATLICDILKGALMVVIASWLDNVFNEPNAAFSAFENTFILGNLKYIAGVFAVLGHDFPIYYGFRGGKGVATSLGVVFALNVQVGLIVAAAAVCVMIFSRYVSLGSIVGGGIYPFVLFTYLLASGENMEKNITYIVMSFILAVLLIGKHHSNIVKLRNGTENKLFARKNNEDAPEEDEV